MGEGQPVAGRIVTARTTGAPVAPGFGLPSTAAGTVHLADLVGRGPVLLLFVSEECPTSTMAVRRLASVLPSLAAVGVTLVAIFEDLPEVAARVARRAGFSGLVLAEPPPYDVSRVYDLVSLPTTVLVTPDLRQAGRVVGWDSQALGRLLADATALAGGGPAPAVPADPPTIKPGCAAKSTYDAATLVAVDRDRGDGGADIEEMYERGWTDGLPVVPPTPERVEAMLGGWNPAITLGPVPPGMGEATLERVAACAVLAGCRPAYFPVVLAAVEAALDPAFNLGGQAVTTQPAGQLVVVNGAARDRLGLHSGMGALGPGWRPNMTIGRALRLVVTLTGQGAPGRLDRSTLGHPGKLGWCLAEDEEASPWEPLHVERGFRVEDSVVTLVACDAPLSISDHRSRTPEDLAWVLGWAAASTWSTNWWPLGTQSLYVICPEHAAMFRDAGWSKQRLREAMFDAVRRPARELTRGETTPVVHASDPDDVIPKWTSPEEIVLLVAGGEAGRYSALLGPCLGMGSQLVSREVSWTAS